MPSRKNGSNEAPTEPRTSLRRLSSIASLQTFNPFNRRRSNNTTDSATTASSSSNLSLSSTTANAPQPLASSSSSSHFFQHADNDITALPPVPAPTASRKSTYVCLPDDPIGGMPRSRTFSNLPLPTRFHRSTPMTASKSNFRLPSALLPSTRLPSPPASTRKHSAARLLSGTEAKSIIGRDRMKRSDTEPLLPVQVGLARNVPRSTAFKENISLSPVKPLPPMFMLGELGRSASGVPSSSSTCGQHGCMDASEGLGPQLQESSSRGSSGHLPRYAEPSGRQNYASSPAYRGPGDRQPALGPSQPEPVQRWNSQPALTNVTNRRDSQHSNITQRRLTVEVQPAPPPSPKTPSGDQARTSGKAKKLSANASVRLISRQSWNSSGPRPSTPPTDQSFTTGKVKKLNNSGPLRLVSQPSPSAARSARTEPPSPRKPNTDEVPIFSLYVIPSHHTDPSVSQITKAESTAYWCGRFAALNDRYRNEELTAHLHNPRAESDKMHTPEANSKRMRRALESLHSLCATADARTSLVVFQQHLASIQNDPELSRPMQLRVPERMAGPGSADREQSVESEASTLAASASSASMAMSEVRKASFMDRLLGRRRKSVGPVL